MDLDKLRQKIEEKTTIDPITNCWLYNGTINNGYGRIESDGFGFRVHRVSAAIYLGYNLSDEICQVLHKCPNKNCWNPDHIYIGTHTDNMQDRIKTGTNYNQNSIKTHCKYGHELDEKNTYVTKQGYRQCKTCNQRRQIERRSYERA